MGYPPTYPPTHLDGEQLLGGLVLGLEDLGEVPVPQLVQDVEVGGLGSRGHSGGGRELRVQGLCMCGGRSGVERMEWVGE
jgi:hypothetical protein